MPKSTVMKAIVSGVGGAASFAELWLAPHSLPWIVCGAILAAGTTAGVWAVPNTPAVVNPRDM